ncbi:hypothetical protein RF11_02329 [Thelohanellus kitauei]|uniref:Uncharacterized protein n=1 Tax=Thelohanellus kitauei TaxID=669202 RepID=A0A0C2MUK9_THEKT|nr:hypothetical protein RF11_02329 [Thelohanellus kitauei]
MMMYTNYTSSGNITMIECDTNVVDDCTYVFFKTSKIAAGSKITLTTSWLVNSSELMKINTNFNITSNFVIKKMVSPTGQSNEKSSSITFVEIVEIKEDKKPKIWPLIVAVVCAIIVVVVTCIILWKLKVFEKLKFKQPSDEP